MATVWHQVHDEADRIRRHPTTRSEAISDESRVEPITAFDPTASERSRPDISACSHS